MALVSPLLLPRFPAPLLSFGLGMGIRQQPPAGRYLVLDELARVAVGGRDAGGPAMSWVLSLCVVSASWICVWCYAIPNTRR